MNIANLIQRLPKAELHLHIEGTLEPELMLEQAAKRRHLAEVDSVLAEWQSAR